MTQDRWQRYATDRHEERLRDRMRAHDGPATTDEARLLARDVIAGRMRDAFRPLLVVEDPRHGLGVVVDGDGTVTPVVADVTAADLDVDAIVECSRFDIPPEHERLGPLPKDYRLRTGSLTVCGAPTRTSGAPCRVELEPGRDCPHHGPQRAEPLPIDRSAVR